MFSFSSTQFVTFQSKPEENIEIGGPLDALASAAVQAATTNHKQMKTATNGAVLKSVTPKKSLNKNGVDDVSDFCGFFVRFFFIKKLF